MQPSGQPTGQPSSHPSGQPTTTPSARPTSSPTNPTGQPTSSPTLFTVPEIVRIAGSDETTYYCHTDHLHNTRNPWQQIFGGIQLSGNTDFIKEVHVWVSQGFNNATDGFSLAINNHVNYATENYIMSNISENHMWLTMALQLNGSGIHISPNSHVIYDFDHTGQNRSWVENWVWTEVMRQTSYAILSDQYDCETLVGGKRIFALQMWDRRDRESSIYYHTLNIETAGIIYSDAEQVITTNDQVGEIRMNPNRTITSGIGVLSMV